MFEKVAPVVAPNSKEIRDWLSPRAILSYSGQLQTLEARFICVDYSRMRRIHATDKIEWVRPTGAKLRLLATVCGAESNPITRKGASPERSTAEEGSCDWSWLYDPKSQVDSD